MRMNSGQTETRSDVVYVNPHKCPDVDYRVVVKSGGGVLVRIITSDGRATPDFRALFEALQNPRMMTVTAVQMKTDSAGLFVGELHLDSALVPTPTRVDRRPSRASWLSWLRRFFPSIGAGVPASV